MDIFKYFQQKGINTLDPSFYRKISEWHSWYQNNVRGFSSYRVYTGQGTYTRKRRLSLGMAKRLSEDMADLLLNEKVEITLAHVASNAYLQKILEDCNFFVVGNDYQERMAYSGTVAFIPYLADMEVDESGNLLSGVIKMDYVSASNIYPVSWENGRITECVFAFPKRYRRRKYLHLQHHKQEVGKYVIYNSVLEISAGSQTGTELSPAEWSRLGPFANLAERIETGFDKPQYVIDRLNIVNNADEDETNPMGIAIFANAIDVLRKIDTEFDSYHNEFDLGRKRIFVAPELLQNKDGSPAFDPEDTVFYKLPDDFEGDKIKEIDMSLRTEAHSQAINDDLRYLGVKCGMGATRYRFDGAGVKTATEVISEDSDLYRSLKKHEIILESVLKELAGIILRLGALLGEDVDPETEVLVRFDDSIIEDAESERVNDRADVAMGAMTLVEYRAKWYGETLEEAAKNVQQPAELMT